MAFETAFPENAAAISASNSARFKTPSTITASGAGTVAVIPWGSEKDTSVSFVVAAGGIVPVKVRAVLATGTSATGLVRVW